MADNTKIGPIFRSANGGLSDDLFTGIKNSFYYSNNIEIREDAKSIYPKQSPRLGLQIDLGEYSTTGKAKAARQFNGHWYIFTEKNVYKLDEDEETSTGIASWIGSLSNEYVLDAELFAGYVYIATTKNLYRIAQNAADASWGDGTNFTKITLNTSNYHPLYATDVMMVVGNGVEVSKVTREIPDQIQSGLTLQDDYRVKFINELGGFIRIIAEDGYYGAELLLWDKVSSAASEIIPMNGYKFLQSRIYNGYHYLLSNKGLGLMNGYQFYILKRIEEIKNYDRITNGMIVYDDKLYFVKSDGIYIYGAKNKNYNDVLNLWSARYDTRGGPGALATDGDNILYTESSRREDSATAHLWAFIYLPGAYKGSDGEFQTMAYFGSSMSEIKQAMYLRVGYSMGGTYMKIYYRTEADATDEIPNNRAWHELTPEGGLYDGSDMRAPFATSLKLNCRFQWIQFKFVLLQGVLSSKNVKLYSADLYYNDMLD